MNWYIITGEFPPQPGGVSDYTYQLAQALRSEDEVHVLAPEYPGETPALNRVNVHRLPRGFGLRWLRALNHALPPPGGDETILVQYVPHGFGWKAMNLAFCFWLVGQKNRRVFVMFHEVAYPFKANQPLKHDVLAVVHRLMAWMLAGSAARSFASIEPYRLMLKQISPGVKVDLLRICSNVPFGAAHGKANRPIPIGPRHFRTVGIFSNFHPEIRRLLESVIPGVLANPTIRFRLIGPGAAFVEEVCAKFPELGERISTTGHVRSVDAGPHLQACDALLQIYPDGAAGSRGTLTAALASGVPVITNPGHLMEPIFETSGAVALAVPEPGSIRRAIEELFSDHSATERIGAAGRKLYEDHFDIAVIVDVLRRAAEGTVAERQQEAVGAAEETAR